MHKIIIVGPSGAGKTTLAQALSRKLDIPHFELDSLFHQKNWQPLDTDEFKKRVHEITDTPQWILCGNYFSKLDGIHLWAKADTVIWCDYPFPLVFSRLLRRTVLRTTKKQELWNENYETITVNFFSKNSVLLYMISDWNEMRVRYDRIYNDDSLPNTLLVRLKNPKDTIQLLEEMQ